MRCLSCNKELSDREATRKFDVKDSLNPNDMYIDLCDHCLGDSEVGQEYQDDSYETSEYIVDEEPVPIETLTYVEPWDE